jgi:hypothetical protein
MDRLTDRLQEHGDIVDDLEDTKLPKFWQPPGDDIYSFVDKVVGAALCSCGKHSGRNVRLRIGTYRRGLLRPKPESLCVLLGWNTEWQELLVHNYVGVQ